MMNLIINDMTCGHCENVVTRTIKNVDPDAIVNVDLNKHQVAVESDALVGEITNALEQAGYPATIRSLETH